MTQSAETVPAAYVAEEALDWLFRVHDSDSSAERLGIVRQYIDGLTGNLIAAKAEADESWQIIANAGSLADEWAAGNGHSPLDDWYATELRDVLLAAPAEQTRNIPPGPDEDDASIIACAGAGRHREGCLCAIPRYATTSDASGYKTVHLMRVNPPGGSDV